MNEPIEYWQDFLQNHTTESLQMGTIAIKILRDPASLRSISKDDLCNIAGTAEALHHCVTAEMFRRGCRLAFGETAGIEVGMMEAVANLKSLLNECYAPNDIAVTHAFNYLEDEIRKASRRQQCYGPAGR